MDSDPTTQYPSSSVPYVWLVVETTPQACWVLDLPTLRKTTLIILYDWSFGKHCWPAKKYVVTAINRGHLKATRVSGVWLSGFIVEPCLLRFCLEPSCGEIGKCGWLAQFFFSIIYYLFCAHEYLATCMSVHYACAWYLQWPQDGVWFPGTGLNDGCGLSCVCYDQTQVLFKSNQCS